jgi:hypothetical protein
LPDVVTCSVTKNGRIVFPGSDLPLLSQFPFSRSVVAETHDSPPGHETVLTIWFGESGYSVMVHLYVTIDAAGEDAEASSTQLASKPTPWAMLQLMTGELSCSSRNDAVTAS